MHHFALATPPDQVLRRHGVVRITQARHHLDTGPGRKFELHSHEKSAPVLIATAPDHPVEAALAVLEPGQRVRLEQPLWLYTDVGHADVDVREIAA